MLTLPDVPVHSHQMIAAAAISHLTRRHRSQPWRQSLQNWPEASLDGIQGNGELAAVYIPYHNNITSPIQFASSHLMILEKYHF